MKVIDLLNLVYEKKAPRKILYKYCEYEFNPISNDYENKDGLELFSYLFQNEEEALFKEIEIIEEDKEIEELEIDKDEHNQKFIKYPSNSERGYSKNFDSCDIYLAYKINELIKEVNKLKKEGK